MGRYIFASLSLLVLAFSLSGTGADLHCPFDWFSHNESCYKLFKFPKSWDTAKRTCEEEQENGQLASIKDVEESVKMSNYLSEIWPRVDVWIGLRLSKRKGKWEWSDGSNITHLSWEKGQPNNVFNLQFCAVLSARSRYLQWNDKACWILHRFLCKFQPRSEASSG